MIDNLDKLFEKIQKLIRPVKEDLEIVKSKVSKIDTRQGVMAIEIKSLGDQQSVINEKIDVLDDKIEEVNKNVLHVLKYASDIEDERDKNEKRLIRVESKLGIVS